MKKFIRHTLKVVAEIERLQYYNKVLNKGKRIWQIRQEAITNIADWNNLNENTIRPQVTRGLGIKSVDDFDRLIKNWLDKDENQYELLNIILNQKKSYYKSDIAEIFKAFKVEESIKAIITNELRQKQQIKFSKTNIANDIDITINNTNIKLHTENLKDEILKDFIDTKILIEGKNHYILATETIDIEKEELEEEDIEALIDNNKLTFNRNEIDLSLVNNSNDTIYDLIDTDNVGSQSRYRKGQNKLRELTLKNYNNQCAICDINDTKLLIAAHIVRWADDKKARGNLKNLICLCRFHDALFEYGYIALDDDYNVIKKQTNSSMIDKVCDESLQLNSSYKPDKKFIKRHRKKWNYE